MPILMSFVSRLQIETGRFCSAERLTWQSQAESCGILDEDVPFVTGRLEVTLE